MSLLAIPLLMMSSSGVLASETSFSTRSAISFNAYLTQLRQEANALGIDKTTIDTAFPQIKRFKQSTPSKQTPNLPASLETYLPISVSEANVITARAYFKEHKDELERLGEKYGVQPRFILALWGIESNYGAHTVSYPVLSVTASLAYESREPSIYKSEFFAALNILSQKRMAFDDLRGSRTGGMGQIQFSPSMYLDYAQDGNSDGNKDIWNNTLDALASAADFLKHRGWKSQETWGRQVKVPQGFDAKLASLSLKKTFSQWSGLGLTRFDGSALPARNDMFVSLIMPDGPSGRKYLIYDNYRSLLGWRNSDYFAISVTYLSERLK
ncbi:membrane-bound lytic murein transglycosylase B, putative [Shewanella violacea DSS12]|uniref:Membrane-bound lytic murein transglycosylase B, putative n=1 Tax=Shewanella violacea (strain JCM 10179 / CIP 106290 / LMG 19151 / DSS12) TaxID=637905 RepID=D4ZL87_SHEVD|nr:membrane-bound lytic murein transglycosylase B, putative [Shewanella violacea DSS12]